MSYKCSLSVLVTLVCLCVHLSSGAGTVSFVSVSHTVSEGMPGGQVCVEASMFDAGDSVEVQVTTNDQPPQDIMISPTMLTLTMGSPLNCWTVTAVDDGILEDDETVTLTLMLVGTTANITLGDQSTTSVMIPANGGLTVEISLDKDAVAEGGTVTATATVNGQSERNFIVEVELISGSPEDLSVGSPATLTLDQDMRSRTWTVTAEDDTIFEKNEDVTLTLMRISGTDGVTLGTPITGSVRIIDNDRIAVAMSVNPSQVTEDSPGTPITVTVEATGQSEKDFAVEVRLTAGSSADITVPSISLTLTNSNRMGFWTVTAVDDDIFENTETITLTTTRVMGIERVDLGNGSVVIMDNDGLTVELSLSKQQVTEGGTVTATATVNGQSERDFSVTVGLTGSSQDLMVPVTLLSLEQITLSDTLTVTAVDDRIFEGPEMVTLTLQRHAGTNGVTLGSQKTVAIMDKDGVTVEMTVAEISIIEGGTVSVCTSLALGRNDRLGTSVVVRFTTSFAGTAVAADVMSMTQQTMTFTHTSIGNKCVTIQTTPDTLYEGNETFTVTLSVDRPENGVTFGMKQTTVTIQDNDEVTVNASVGQKQVTEGMQVEVCADLTGSLQRDVTVQFQTEVINGVNDGAASGTDYTALVNTMRTFRSGATSQCVNVQTLNDFAYEYWEIFRVTITLVTTERVNLGNQQFTEVTIMDDHRVTVSMVDTSITRLEGDDDVSVCARLSPSSLTLERPVKVTLTSSQTGEASDFTFTSISMMHCVNVSVPDNLVFEQNPLSEVTVTLTKTVVPNFAQGRVDLGITTTTVTVNDNDSPEIRFEHTSYMLNESAVQTSEDVCVTLVGQSELVLPSPVQITFMIQENGAEMGSDYTVSNLQAQFDSVNTKKCITVTILNDEIGDPDESFEVSVTSTNNQVQIGGPATVVIIDDDVLPPVRSLVIEQTSMSITLSWREPDTSRTTESVTGYTVTWTGGVAGSQAVLPSTLSYRITGLEPYMMYVCSIIPNYSGENRGAAVTRSVQTLEEAPEGPPLALSLSTSMATSLTVSWSPPAQPNGLITHYTIYVDYGNGSTAALAAMTTMFTISPLRPYQTVTVQVSASTSVGEGPTQTNILEFTTDQARSGPVGNLTVIRMDNATLRVEWTEPDELNGVLQTYTVHVGIHGSENMTQYNTSMLSRVINELDPFTPYEILVLAVNGAGLGEPSSEVEFTAEGEPNSPSVVHFERIDDTTAIVSWEPLSLFEARGFITEYNVTYWRVGSSQDDAETISVRGNQSSVVITGLNPGDEYFFTVSASTAQGVGNSSAQMRLPTTGGDVAVIAGVIGGLAVALILLFCIICILCIRKRRQKYYSLEGKPKPKPLPPPKPKSVSMEFELTGKEKAAGAEKLQEVEDDIDTSALLPESDEPGQEDIPLTDFADHVKQMHKHTKQGFEREYKSIKDGGHPWEASQLPCNKVKKNRFTNIFPYDHCRVKLEDTGKPGSDYINASWLNGYQRDNAYIAAQGPLPDTVDDFWRMIWENKLPTIVMVTRTVENGREKCQQYWPKSTDEFMNPGLKIIVTQKELKVFTDYEIRVLSVKNVAEPDVPPFLITHFYYLGWPDHGVPEYATSILGFLRRVRKSHPVSGPPLLVHCSAGVGRTGTFIVLDTMLQWIQHERSVNVCQFVREMRQRRCQMVQTMSQYVFIHDALDELISCGNTEVAAHNLNIAIIQMAKVSAGKVITGFDEQFQLLEQVSRKPSAKDWEIFNQLEVESKNRYPQKFPYENHRPKLSGSSRQEQYINANFIDGYKQRKCFVATQAPLSSTVGDLWRMIWKLESRTIVMLCDLVENGKEMCAQYWPEGVGEEVRYGKLNIKLLSEDKEKGIIKRRIEVAPVVKGTSNESYILTLFHYTSWNENGPQPAPESVILLNELVVNCQKSTGNKPIIVMCNDGCGRTGTFMSVYSVIDRFKVEAVVDVFQCVKAARIQRMALVANVEQYTLIYNVLKQYMMSFEQYANFTDVV